MEKSPKKDYRSANNAFHKTKIHWAAICVCGFHSEPEAGALHDLLSRYQFNIKTMETTCSTIDEDEKDYYYYVYIDFQPFFWTEQLIEDVQDCVRRELAQPGEILHVIHKHSMVDQIFLGGLHPFLKEKDLVQLFSGYGTLINVEVKRRSNGRSRCFGFATYLNSRESVCELIEKRYVTSGSDHIEIKSIGNGKTGSHKTEISPINTARRDPRSRADMVPSQNSMPYSPIMMQPFMMMPNGMMMVPAGQMAMPQMIPTQQMMMSPSTQQMQQMMQQMMAQCQMLTQQQMPNREQRAAISSKASFGAMGTYDVSNFENASPNTQSPDSPALNLNMPFNCFGMSDGGENSGLESIFACSLDLNSNISSKNQ